MEACAGKSDLDPGQADDKTGRLFHKPAIKEEHVMMKCSTGEILKINTPEKMKKASVVLEKLAMGDTFRGIRTDYEKTGIKSSINSLQPDKSFSYSIEYKVKHNSSASNQYFKPKSSNIKTSSNQKKPAKSTSPGQRATSGHVNVLSRDSPKDSKFRYIHSNKNIYKNLKPTPGLNLTSMTIKHEDNARIRGSTSRDKYDSSLSLENHSSDDKTKRLPASDILCSLQLSSASDVKKFPHLQTSTKTSPPKVKTTSTQANLPVLRHSDMKPRTETQKQNQAFMTFIEHKADSEEVMASALREARARFTSKLKNIATEPYDNLPVDQDTEQVQRCKVVPSILSHVKHRPPTVRELLNRKDELVINDQRHGDISMTKDAVNTNIKAKRPTKSTLPRRNISRKRDSVSFMVYGKSSEGNQLKDELGEELPNKCEKSLTKRYKNTRYTIPFQKPSIVVPKDYHTFVRAVRSKLEPTITVTGLPGLTENTSKLLRRRYKKTGKVTTVPIGTKTTESQIRLCPRIHTMKKTQGLLNINSIQAPHSPTCKSFEKKAQSRVSQSLSPNKNVTTCLEKSPEFILKGHSSAISQFYAIPTSKRDCESIAEQKHLDTAMAMSNYDAIDDPTIDIDMSSFCRVPNNSPVRLTPVLPERQCTGCFYCEYERIMKSIDNNCLIEVPQKMSDHAYTKTPSTTFEKTGNFNEESGNSGINVNSNDTLITTHSAETKLHTEKIENNVPFYAFQFGDKILLMPCSAQNLKPQISTKRESSPNYREEKMNLGHLKFSGGVHKKKRQRKTTFPKKNNFRNMCKDQMKFSKVLDLHPSKEKSKSATGIELVVDVMQENVNGRNPELRLYAPVILIERSIDGIFTHISKVACLMIKNGSDAELKRWNDFEDYPVRLKTDNISGAINEIEIDTCIQGLYKVMKTGQKSMSTCVSKTIAILSTVLPNVTTILNDSMFLAIGPTISYYDIEQPANIQKHRNMQYLLTTVESVVRQPVQESVVSDRSYRPKCHSPSWYRAPRFDAFTRLYYRQRKFSTTGDKPTDIVFTSL